MRLSDSQLARMKDEAASQYTQLTIRSGESADAFVTRCWLTAVSVVLGKSNEELYVFPKNYNDNIVDPNKFLDVSGKLQLD